MKLKVSLDLDDTVVSFMDHYISYFGQPKSDFEITKNVYKSRKDSEFWLTQPVIHCPNFIPHCYCTARIISKSLIKRQIEINKLPKAPVYQVFGYNISKIPQLRRSGCNVHIDDSLKNFINLNLAGIPCLLMDSPNNQEWGPIGRIQTLDEYEIEAVYELFMETVFDDFKELIYGNSFN